MQIGSFFGFSVIISASDDDCAGESEVCCPAQFTGTDGLYERTSPSTTSWTPPPPAREIRGTTLRLVGFRYRCENRGGKMGLVELESYLLKQGEAAPNVSGRQEFLENLINEFIW